MEIFQHDGNVSAWWKYFSMMEIFQHDGGVKSLKIKQQRDGTESVIWNLASSANYSNDEWLIGQTMVSATSVSFYSVLVPSYFFFHSHFMLILVWLASSVVSANSVRFLSMLSQFLVCLTLGRKGFWNDRPHLSRVFILNKFISGFRFHQYHRWDSLHLYDQFSMDISIWYWCWLQVMLIAERGEAEFGFAAIDSITFKDLSEEPCETFPPQVTTRFYHHQEISDQGGICKYLN